MPVSLVIKDLKVRSLDQDFLELSWKIEDVRDDVLDYTFQVFRSESPEGPWDPLGVPFEDKYIFIDNTVKVEHRWRKYWYILRVVHKATNDVRDTVAVAREPDADLVTLELRRHMQLLFREASGRRCWVLPERTYGQRCSCWNPTLQKRTRSGCVTCYDTGFVRGYLSPIESWIQIEPSAKSEQQSAVGGQQQSNTTAKAAWYPTLKPRDIIVEGENRRWRVVTVSQTENGRATVHQELQLHEIPPKDIEYKIPIELDRALRDIWLSPERNFSNPQNLESFEEAELPSIFDLYGRSR
jgi:hypothetical protein